jgi:DNA-binding MarR family transcriptional regulator
MNELSEHDRIARLARTCANLNLRRAARAVSNYFDSVFLAACGLRATQIPPLVVLYLAGPQTINEIAARLELDRTTLSRNLKPLKEAGLLEIASGDDLRTRMVALTEHGRETLINVLPVWEEAQAHMVQGLSEERFSALLTQLSDIAELTREEELGDLA